MNGPTSRNTVVTVVLLALAAAIFSGCSSSPAPLFNGDKGIFKQAGFAAAGKEDMIAINKVGKNEAAKSPLLSSGKVLSIAENTDIQVLDQDALGDYAQVRILSGPNTGATVWTLKKSLVRKE